jgi:hypothetical protein
MSHGLSLVASRWDFASLSFLPVYGKQITAHVSIFLVLKNKDFHCNTFSEYFQSSVEIFSYISKLVVE